LHDDVAWVTSHFCRPLNIMWINRKHHAATQDSFDSVVVEIRKPSLLLNIRDSAINNMLGLTQGNTSYATYTQLSNDFLRRSRQPLTDDLQCLRFISGLANFQLQTQAKSHRAQQKGYNLPLVELQKFLNDLVADSPHLGRAGPRHCDKTRDQPSIRRR
jgi:hypothetical protein